VAEAPGSTQPCGLQHRLPFARFKKDGVSPGHWCHGRSSHGKRPSNDRPERPNPATPVAADAPITTSRPTRGTGTPSRLARRVSTRRATAPTRSPAAHRCRIALCALRQQRGETSTNVSPFCWSWRGPVTRGLVLAGPLGLWAEISFRGSHGSARLVLSLCSAGDDAPAADQAPLAASSIHGMDASKHGAGPGAAPTPIGRQGPRAVWTSPLRARRCISLHTLSAQSRPKPPSRARPFADPRGRPYAAGMGKPVRCPLSLTGACGFFSTAAASERQRLLRTRGTFRDPPAHRCDRRWGSGGGVKAD